MRIFKTAFLLAVFWIAAANTVFSQTTVFESGSQQTHLIELYSSEGCSSCPPAEEWVSELQSLPGLWRDFIPVVFHVDYWDRLGWKDPFSSEDFTYRQQVYVQSWRQNTVYTPDFVLDGQEWRPAPQLANFPGKSKSRGALRLEVLDGNKYRLTFKPESLSREKFDAHVVLLGSGIQSRVAAGENSGQLLKHDFTVLGYKHGGLDKNGSTTFKLEMSSALPANVKPGMQAVAAWVTQGDNPAPVQAVGGPLS